MKRISKYFALFIAAIVFFMPLKMNLTKASAASSVDDAGTLRNSSAHASPLCSASEPNGYIYDGCYITAVTNMLRRRQVIDGGSASITKYDLQVANSSSEKPSSVKDFKQIKWPVGGYSITETNDYSKSNIITLLNNHPEGIMITAINGGIKHAIILTSYNSSTEVFYAVDPVNGGTPIPIGSCYSATNDKKSVKLLTIDDWIRCLTHIYFINNAKADTILPSITNAVITDVSSNGYTVTCSVADNVGVTSVKFPTWTLNGGQDDLKWLDGTINGDVASITIKTSDHNNETGIYITHIYAYDASENQICYVVPDITVQAAPVSNSLTPAATVTCTPTLTPTVTPITSNATTAEISTTDDKTNNGAIPVAAISSPGDLQNLIDSDLDYSSQDTLSYDNKTSKAYKIEANEEGWIFISVYKKTGASYFSPFDIKLYTNSALTSVAGSTILSFDNNVILAVYVEPGDYYYQIKYKGNAQDTCTCYIGFMPSSARIKVDSIQYSNDKSQATVKFDFDEDCFGSFSDGTLRVVNGNVSYKDMSSNEKWKTDSKENMLLQNSFTVTENGTYSARLACYADNYFCKVQFEITDIISNAPAAPKITAYKKNSKTVSGVGNYGNTISLKVNGKYYDSVINKDGNWSISVPALKKGLKLTAYVKNPAGTKSKTTTVTVK